MAKTFFEKFKEKQSVKWLAITANIIIIATLLGGGYGAGNYLSELNCAQKLLDTKEDYQSKIFEHRQTCNFSKINELEKRTNSIQLTVEQIKKIQNEK